MSVSLIRISSGENETFDTIEKYKASQKPWDLADLSDYLNYCCPECQFKSKQQVLFRDHMKQNHRTTNSRRKINVNDLIRRFLDENDEPKTKVLKLPSNIDVIQNPPLLLPQSFHEQDQVKPEKDDRKYSVSIFKVTNTDEFESPNDEADFLEDINHSPQSPEEDDSSSAKMSKDSKKCQDCSIVFLTPFRLQRHIKKFHGGVTPTMASSDTPIGDDSKVAEMPRPYTCQLCQKCFTSHAYLSSHIRKAHEKRFRCEECGKCYGGGSYLREHIEAVHRKTKNFTCESCAASFYSKTQLSNHCLRNHSEGEEKPCDECGKVFTNDLSLKLHLKNVHQPVKSICSQCGKEYPNEVSLKKHIQCVHEKKKPFQCHICSKMFGSKWYVQQHITKMHEEQQRPSFKCQECDFEFSSVKERNSHALKVHGRRGVKKVELPNIHDAFDYV